MTDLGNQRDVERRNKAAKISRNKVREGLQWLLADERGRRYLADLVRETDAVAAQVAVTSDGVMFREGKRSMGLKILSDVQAHAPEQFAALLAAVLTNPTDGAKDGDRADTDE